jgi:hypothetical protein
MSDSIKSPATHALRVTSIRVEYDDGSYDLAELRQINPIILYGLTHSQPDSTRPRGAYTNGAVAAFLFKTAVTTLRADYAVQDSDMIRLLQHWFSDVKTVKQKKEETNNTE